MREGHPSPTSLRSSNYLFPLLVIEFTGARNVNYLESLGAVDLRDTSDIAFWLFEGKF